jgi:hypothetical protein
MGLIADLASVAINALTAITAKLVADDVKEWIPDVVEQLINRAVDALPDEESRERYSEQWRSDVADTPGIIRKLWFAARCHTASRRIVREVQGEAAWVRPIMEWLAYRGARIIQRPLLRAFREELLKQQCDPILCDAAVGELERRFEPVLQQMLRTKLRKFGNYHQSAEEIRQEFARVIWDYRRELQSQIHQSQPKSLDRGNDYAQRQSTDHR